MASEMTDPFFQGEGLRYRGSHMLNQDRTASQLSIERLMQSLEAAWAREDADAYASRFAEDGTFTNFLGMFFRGREAFRERHDVVFKTVFRGSELRLRIAALRFIRPEVAVADLEAEVQGIKAVPSGLVAMPNGVVRTKLLMVLVMEQGEWWISTYHNVAVAAPAPSA
jgi:uncharacterized protein (TIGR02246 family)